MRTKNKILDMAHNAFLLKSKINELVGKIYALSSIEVDILTFVYLYGNDATATSFEHERNFKKNTISIHIENLVQLGYLDRVDCPDDRRLINLTLTPRAKVIAKRVIEENEKLKKELLNGLSEEEKMLLNRAVDTMNENAKKMLKEIK